MSITAVLVLFSIIWFLVLFLSLQINIKTQGDTGKIVEGTHASSPDEFDMKKRILVTTVISIPSCILVVYVILSGIITLDMFDFYNLIEK